MRPPWPPSNRNQLNGLQPSLGERLVAVTGDFVCCAMMPAELNDDDCQWSGMTIVNRVEAALTVHPSAPQYTARSARVFTSTHAICRCREATSRKRRRGPEVGCNRHAVDGSARSLRFWMCWDRCAQSLVAEFSKMPISWILGWSFRESVGAVDGEMTIVAVDRYY